VSAHVGDSDTVFYLTEWEFKWNTRKMKDGDHAATALKGIEGKRLTYRIPHSATNN
jgi:hypothetical protein